MKYILTLTACCLLLACGGGTSGSSSTGGFVEKSIIGTLKDENGQPLAFATVEIEATGETITTDANGALSGRAALSVGINQFLLTATDNRRYLIEEIVDETDRAVALTSLYPKQGQLQYGRWELRGRVTGVDCEPAFFSSLEIPQDPAEAQRRRDADEQFIRAFGYTGFDLRQVFDVTPGTTCIAEIEVLKNGVPVSQLPYKALVNRCAREEGSPGLEQFDAGVTDAAGKILVALTIEGSQSDLCNWEVQIPTWGDLELGAVIGVSARDVDRP